MIYLKVLDADGKLSSVEAIETPVYIKYQTETNCFSNAPRSTRRAFFLPIMRWRTCSKGKNRYPG